MKNKKKGVISKTIFVAMSIATVVVIGGCVTNKPISVETKDGVNVNMPGLNVNVGDDGVNVNAPGLDVEVNDNSANADAQDVDAETSDNSVNVNMPGLNVNVDDNGVNVDM